MEELNKNDEMRNKLIDELEKDPLFHEIKQRRHEYNELLSDEFLQYIEVKKWYSTVQAAEMFNISDSKLRYYLKPLYEYILTEDTPSSSSSYRLNYLSIVKLKMILLLKDEFKVAGIQTLIGMRGKVVNTAKTTNVSNPKADDEKVQRLENIIAQIFNTGLFIFEEEEGEDLPNLKLNKEALLSELTPKLIEYENVNKELSNIKKELAHEREEKANLKKHIGELKSSQQNSEESLEKKLEDKMIEVKEQQKQDVAILLSKRLEVKKLEKQALEAWKKEKSAIARILSSEDEKQQFVIDYIENELKSRND
ncbi:hypothetical protein V1503_24725 [Bacillus sp. SCS-151]|uniref:hypothetical protein n=1 Tax=Nanhaiella sioensis TaxID=3115293 RepID=UPI0039796B82